MLRLFQRLSSAVLVLAFVVERSVANPPAATADITESDPQAAAAREQQLITGARQLTFEGKRAGEGYFSSDGSKLVFQSERDPANPFFQIFLLDMETGDVERVSNGTGKTTCAWIHPEGKRVLFASTHDDPKAKDKQAAEIELRKSGKERRYAWDYDDSFELYEFDPTKRAYRNLTNARGYDAEASWSPDGKLIVFASNRRAYGDGLSAEERKHFETDPATAVDIYSMNADGGGVQRLTTSSGYDGGPFFSPDGKRICWRRFAPDGATAEVMTMNVDGSDQRALTSLGAMSWAPFFHPSGEYLIFTTNVHGFANFELYFVAAHGKSAPARVTYTSGFDGLPAFSPDGTKLAWTSNRTPGKQSQIFLASWNHSKALELLRQSSVSPTVAESNAAEATTAGRHTIKKATPDYEAADVRAHVEYLCKPELAGRLTGTPGEQLATAYVAGAFEELGLLPAGDNGSYFQEFPFTAGVALGKENALAAGGHRYTIDDQWRPVAFSETGKFAEASVVFAGYGIASGPIDGGDEYDSYVHLDVKDKWVLCLRFLPEEIKPERRQQLARFSSLRHKTMTARDKQARGLIVVTGPNAKAKSDLIPLQFDGSLSGTSLPVISMSSAVADQWLSASGKKLKELQDKLDTGAPMMGFELKDLKLSAQIDVQKVKRTGRNVLGRLPAGDKPSGQMVIVGAHVDHLGAGGSASSLARDDEKDQIHFGADDNASGVAAMIEIAQSLADQRTNGKLALKRDIVFAAWSGEELGLIGSSYFVEQLAKQGSSKSGPAHSLSPRVASCLNLDMVGRLDKALILQGIGSSSVWRSEIERRNAPIGLPLSLQEDSYVPTDASAFFMRGVPILSAFTGSHPEYHTPRDTPEKLNYEGAAKIGQFIGLVARSQAMAEKPADYIAQSLPSQSRPRAQLRAYLGTIPDYADSDVKGVKLSGAAKNGPAAKAGVQPGDVIVELAGKKIENIYDYTYAIEALKIGQPITIVVQRKDKRVPLEVTPGSRE